MWNGTDWDAKSDSVYIDSAGNDTTLSVSYSMNNPIDSRPYRAAGSTAADGDERLLSGVSQKSGPIALSNVPYATYDLIVYVPERNDGGFSGSVTVSGDDITDATIYADAADSYDDIHKQSTATAPEDATEATYVRFNGLTNTSDVTITVGDGTSYSDSMAGFQIVPEPATMALLGLGGLGVFLRRKRR